MKKNVFVEIEILAQIEIDYENEIVSDYEDIGDLVSDIISYKFSSVLPVVSSGAAKINFDSSDFKILNVLTN